MKRIGILLSLLLSISLVFAPACRPVDQQQNAEDPPSVQNEQANSKKTAEDRVTTPENTFDTPSFANLVEKLKPSVVNISTTKVIERGRLFPYPFGEDSPFNRFFEDFFDNLPRHEYRKRGLGSGFIISEDGYIVTNNHVIQGAEDIKVILEEGKEYEAEIVGTDPKTDIALLKIDPDNSLHSVEFGNSDKLRIGDWVIAIGNPFGLGHTVTSGIVSAKGRVLGLGEYDDFIQIDAPINPGNSGGPLFNLKGEAVGVNTAIIAGGQGIGFAIPINMVERIVSQLKENGEVVRGWLGVMVQQITPEISKAMDIDVQKGALVSDVVPKSPADKAGLERGDVIVEFDGRKIDDIFDLTSLVAMTPPGTETEIVVIRDGERKTLSATIEKLKEKQPMAQRAHEDLGITVSNITPQLENGYNLSVSEGVVITDVERGSIADLAGIKEGDVILQINRRTVRNTGDYNKLMETIGEGDTVLFLLRRGDNSFYIALEKQ